MRAIIAMSLAVEEACSRLGNMPHCGMRVIARNTLVRFWSKHPEAKVALERWYTLVRAAHWSSTDEIQRAAPKSRVLNRDRVRFEIAGGNYRLVVAVDFPRQVAFVKFIGSHAEYDRIDALTVSRF
jgi:mRNA interferase HigB